MTKCEICGMEAPPCGHRIKNIDGAPITFDQRHVPAPGPERPAPDLSALARGEPCTCGSGLHPRRCVIHPERYRQHCDEISAENAEATAAPGGAPTIYARAVNAGAVDAPAAPAADVAACETGCGEEVALSSVMDDVRIKWWKDGVRYCSGPCYYAGRPLHPRSATPETRPAAKACTCGDARATACKGSTWDRMGRLALACECDCHAAAAPGKGTR